MACCELYENKSVLEVPANARIYEGIFVQFVARETLTDAFITLKYDSGPGDVTLYRPDGKAITMSPGDSRKVSFRGLNVTPGMRFHVVYDVVYPAEGVYEFTVQCGDHDTVCDSFSFTVKVGTARYGFLKLLNVKVPSSVRIGLPALITVTVQNVGGGSVSGVRATLNIFPPDGGREDYQYNYDVTIEPGETVDLKIPVTLKDGEGDYGVYFCLIYMSGTSRQELCYETTIRGVSETPPQEAGLPWLAILAVAGTMAAAYYVLSRQPP